MTNTITLANLLSAAQWANIEGFRMPLGGNVVGMSWVYGGQPVLLTLDEGTDSGTTWTVATTERIAGEWVRREAGPFPVTSDADQTFADACGWVTQPSYRPGSDNPDNFEHPVLAADGVTWQERDEDLCESHGVPGRCPEEEETVTLTLTRAQYVTLRSAVQDAYDYRQGEDYEKDLEPYDRLALAELNALPRFDLFPTDAAYGITEEV